ncbi:hypothetical protein CKAN_01596200 [Cinnamomum micranthum f. kanehirae]|uniref:Uncharacterized protein n=1 Tax=Cinnamomum micranthum f. kanehirae TaxID=337451 RepID=A0A443P8E1_9MAGN|nr:hypothetical protein CKAN_01596200 [Cinnamomum micranthum f. kanehirae]
MEATGNVRTEVMDRAELLHLAIQKLRREEEDEEKRNKIFTSSQEEEEEDRRLLARLLSQLESRKDNIDQSEPSTETKALTSSGPVGASAKDENDSEGADIGAEEIVKELREIRKQNTVTHWLLSVLIVITAVWQMSEVLVDPTVNLDSPSSDEMMVVDSTLLLSQMAKFILKPSSFFSILLLLTSSLLQCSYFSFATHQPIKTIVVLVIENCSFDHMLG